MSKKIKLDSVEAAEKIENNKDIFKNIALFIAPEGIQEKRLLIMRQFASKNGIKLFDILDEK